MKITRVVVALIVVGPPVMAWWVGNRRFWGRQWRVGIASGVCMAVAMALLIAEGWGDTLALSSFIGAVAALNLVAQVVVPTFVRRRLRQAVRVNSDTAAGEQP